GNLTTNGTIGVALEHNTGAPVVGLVRHPLTEDTSHGQVGEPWSYPFLLPTNMIRITGNVVSMAAAQGIGNVYVGYISQLVTADTVLSPLRHPRRRLHLLRRFRAAETSIFTPT